MLNSFELKSQYTPAGDQPKAIESLVEGLNSGKKHQTLLGITGSGKTYTMANIIARYNKPTVILSHNKTLAAQLYNELKVLFPNNLIEYYVSYYDYYKPESYLPADDIYLAKTLKINHELEKIRMSAIVSLLLERRDVIIISSVSCIYGIENPQQFKENQLLIRKGQVTTLDDIKGRIDGLFYEEKKEELKHGQYRIKNNTIDIFASHADIIFRITINNNIVDKIESIDPLSNCSIKEESEIAIFSTKLFAITKSTLEASLKKIEEEEIERVCYFEQIGKEKEAKRIRERTEYDLEMIREIGYCSGMENYSRHFENRKPGEKSACLFDYLPKDYLLLIDESHVTIPQLKAMYHGDRARKTNLIDNGFRLPSAYDHRPLTFKEFESFVNKVIYVSATPGEYELSLSENVVEQIIRPTGLLDPKIEVRKTEGQLQDAIKEIRECAKKKEKVFITTLTKKMAEELNSYLVKNNVRSQFLHSSVKTLDRIKILENLENDKIDVVVGVNLLREGIDIPEVALVMILDADKEGFLRNETSIIQTVGRVARNVNGRAILYADTITKSMSAAINKTKKRREMQERYNAENNITPKTAKKNATVNLLIHRMDEKVNFDIDEEAIKTMTKKQKEKLKKRIKKEMISAAEKLNFVKADILKQKLMLFEDKQTQKI